MRTTKLLIAAAAAVAAAPAFAGNTVQVSANLSDTCTLDTTATTLDVSAAVKSGAYVNGQYDIWCTNGYAVKVNVSSTNGFKLAVGGDLTGTTIGYGVYSDSATGTLFSNVAFTGGSSTTSTRKDYWVKPVASNPPKATYTDTLTFTVAP